MRSFQSRSLGFKYWNDQKIRDQVASEFEPASRRNEDIYIEDDTDSWVRDNYYNNAIQYDSLGIPYYGRERSSNMFPQARSLQGRRGRRGRKFDWLSLVKLKPFRVRTRAGRRVDTEYSSNSLGHLLMVRTAVMYDNYVYHVMTQTLSPLIAGIGTTIAFTAVG